MKTYSYKVKVRKIKYTYTYTYFLLGGRGVCSLKNVWCSTHDFQSALQAR